MQNFADVFMQALQEAEKSKNADGLAALFSDGSELINLALTEPMRGAEGAKHFWTNYLAAFETIRSEFSHVTQTEGVAVLEWISNGSMTGSNQDFNYRGVSVIEHDGEKVKLFRSYYDSAVFLPGGAKQKG